ncbi:isochorismatase [Brasilonema octagenarum UFV-E1]|uniref:Isochorismatase n=1 Tax=Brasilonema sennae CENA114 TaxID=415709 RepID=A0A856MRW0_9CYAN|nr:cysteine hydrolase family protein [Brasilonema sennae]QDL11896.1 isochorismatase [Brasilonema sennae CENA114]QDL18270.1 isochorismatase [Brasilonema octagenarum UFV-E1]
MNDMTKTQLPIPPHFNPEEVGYVWRVPYQQRAEQAREWANKYNIKPSSEDITRICLLLIDVQNTFCIPEFELFVGGKSGTGAVDDNVRLCEFVYGNFGVITKIIPTMDTHTAMQIFHPIFWVNAAGEHPTPSATNITPADIEKGVWKVNLGVAASLGYNYEFLEKHAYHYVKQLSQDGKYPLTVWPYHSMLGGIGHALVSAVEEAVFFHSIARQTQTQFEIKGNHPLTENYSVLRPEVLQSFDQRHIGQKNTHLIQQLLDFDCVIIAGQAKSHCVAWTVDDLLTEIQQIDSNLAKKVYLLEDCTSPVVVPGVVDYSEAADAAFERFAASGMHLVQSTQSILSWFEE